ncbi:MAG: hypothetical protein KAS77_02635, partial [Thermoplasmata archaeon]|nr:hypothetical protein [Thermoplasmata archaeon]
MNMTTTNAHTRTDLVALLSGTPLRWGRGEKRRGAVRSLSVAAFLRADGLPLILARLLLMEKKRL